MPKPKHTIILYLQDRIEKESFFNWFYFAINLGSLLAVTAIVYVQVGALYGHCTGIVRALSKHRNVHVGASGSATCHMLHCSSNSIGELASAATQRCHCAVSSCTGQHFVGDWLWHPSGCYGPSHRPVCCWLEELHPCATDREVRRLH